ncbi:MAG: Ig-like domain-containing protein [Acidimicrobiales bacterium]
MIGTATVTVLAILAGIWLVHDSASNIAAAQPVSLVAPFTVSTFPGSGARGVALGAPVNVTVDGGRLLWVVMTDGAGKHISGEIAPDDRSWAVPVGVLSPGETYRISYSASDGSGRAVTRSSSFVTQTPSKILSGDVTPFGGHVVGVGMPITVDFNHPVADKGAVQAALHVTMSTPVVGAWHWFGDREVHFRPQVYWPVGEHVVVALNLAGIYAGRGTWGAVNREVNFSVGQSHISVANVLTDVMTVQANGATIRTVPISAGRVDLPTMGGVHWVLDKEPSVIMDSATVGIPKGSPDYYYETVYNDVHISTTGEYVHAAPWSVVSQGHQNVSHGCVNISPADAAWFYAFSQPGDIVNIVGSPRPPSLSVGGVADWNMTWAQWLAGSAA